MRKYMTYAETESLLITTINLSGSSIKDIAAATDIKANTLYKWKTTPVHLSPEKADKLLLYFVEREPDKLELAEVVLSQKSSESRCIGSNAVGIRFYIYLYQYLHYYHSQLPCYTGSSEEGGVLWQIIKD